MARRGRRPAFELHFDTSTFEGAHVVLDQGISEADNGRYVLPEALRAEQIHAPTPSTLQDAYATWTPASTSIALLDKAVDTHQDSLDIFEDDPTSDDDESGATPTGEKRKRYESSDNPNAVWRRHAIELLHELYRSDGLGDSLVHPCCANCGAIWVRSPASGNDTNTRLFRCIDCNPLFQCLSCLLESHSATPLHRIKEWNGLTLEKTTLSAIGQVYQLGHCGLPCLSPDPTLRKMVVMEWNGFHEQVMRVGWYPATTTDPRTCATFRVLDHYRELNVGATVNAKDFVQVLMKHTDVTDFSELPNRFKVFFRISRQWAFLHRLKESTIGFSIKSLDDIKPGALAEICWACPRVGFNLPKDWEKVDSKYSYLYMPVFALDANFRLKNRIRKNEWPDPSLAPGSGYFVDPEPYKEFLKKYVSEQDVSTCIAFAALLQKDTKLTTGLRTSGVAGCACARHELIRPQGIGDLQKGERYANIDYVFFSAIQDVRLPRLAVSYDIVCQWRQTLWERMSRLPKHLRLNRDAVEFTFGLPTWHAVAHELSCRTANALTYQEGVGRTDGEGIERIWSLLNPSSYATKEMGEGARHDSLDDRIHHHNHMKNLNLASTLARRLIIAVEERDRQVADFLQHDSKLKPDIRKEWEQRIMDWKADPSLPSPFLLTDSCKGASEADVRKELQAEEKEERDSPDAVIHGTSGTACILRGLELEDIQAKIRRSTTQPSLTAAEKSKIDERRDIFFEKLKKFRKDQKIHIPGAARALQAIEASSPSLSPPPEAEDVKLWLPSDFPPAERATACVGDLGYVEARLREGRCNDALRSVRHYLHSKSYLLAFRNANVTGQNASTRARTVINNAGHRVDKGAAKYTWSRDALLSLYDVASTDEYPELTKADITLDEITDADMLALVKLGNVGSTSHRRKHAPTGKKTLSWIWTAQGGPERHEGGVHETVRVEWSKAYERKKRWTEEVETLSEEMKRVRRSLDTKVLWWQSEMPKIMPTNPQHPAAAIQAGMHAYAASQAAYFKAVAELFQSRWGCA